MEKSVNVLLVEDDTVDIEAVQKEFERHRITNPLHIVRDGIEALELLRSGKITKPYLILLDLNMPRMSGLEFLKLLRADSKLKQSIVFVITTSNREEDKKEAYNFNVAGFIRKKNLGEDFVKLIPACDNYWRIVEFPI